MGDVKVRVYDEQSKQEVKPESMKPGERVNWETPKLEDVSEQVMAQPYIRFT